MRAASCSASSSPGFQLSPVYSDPTNPFKYRTSFGCADVVTWNANGICAVRTKFKAEKGAKIRLVQLNLLSQNFRFINDVGAECEDNATAEILQLFIGGNETYTGTKTTLLGRQSNLDLNVGYYCKDEQLLDMNYVAEHIGKKTVSSMNAGGVLRDKAHKLFRGTIDFPTRLIGC